MAEIVQFPSNGNSASGYLVRPASGSGPGVLVIQEWWGLDSGIKEMTDRLGAAGFVALAPDLYHGELAQHDEMDKASHLMQGLPPESGRRSWHSSTTRWADPPSAVGSSRGADQRNL